MSVFGRVMEKLGYRKVPQKMGRRTYAGAIVNRLTQDWFTQILSADQELKADLRRLRGASRSLVRDNAEASRYVQMLGENVSGHMGIQLQMEFRTTRDDPATKVNDAVEAAWSDWCQPENADAGKRLSFQEIERMIPRLMAQDGEAIIRMIRGANNEYGFALQLLDADQLDETLGGAQPLRLENGNEIRMGVEMDPAFGAPVAYHFWSEHPSEYGSPARKRVRIPAEDVLHLYIVLRPGQSRGVPWFAPILLNHKMLGAYEEAEVIAARFGASNMVAVTYDAEKAGGVPEPTAGDEQIPMEMTPGAMFRLNPGESLVPTNIDHPSTAFAPFTKNIKRSIATGLNVAYTSLTGDLEAVNYSSIRAGLLSERDFYRGLQQFVITHFHRIVFREWTKYASVAGAIPVKLPRDYGMAACWKPRGWQWVDPLNDVQAASLSVQEGFATRSDICAEHGHDFEEVIDGRKKEEDYAQAQGVLLGAAKPVVPRQPDTQSGDPSSPATGAASDQPQPARSLKLARSLI